MILDWLLETNFCRIQAVPVSDLGDVCTPASTALFVTQAEDTP